MRLGPIWSYTKAGRPAFRMMRVALGTRKRDGKTSAPVASNNRAEGGCCFSSGRSIEQVRRDITKTNHGRRCHPAFLIPVQRWSGWQAWQPIAV